MLHNTEIRLWGYLLYGAVTLFKDVVKGGQMMVTIKISLGYVYAAMLVGLVLAIFRKIQQIRMVIIGMRDDAKKSRSTLHRRM